MKSLSEVNIIPSRSGACGGGNCGCAGNKDQRLHSTDLGDAIQERYSRIAERGASSEVIDTSCCGNASALYPESSLESLTPQAAGASAGCGNPVGIAEVEPGEDVLDLGSGGGIDCFLAAQATGPEGHVYGVDMTHEMLKLARENADKLDAQNVTFLLGKIEAVPLPDESIDLVISNCVIALAPDKQRVFDEIYRLLRPGGRFVISDIVSESELPEEARQDMEEWVACIGGADLKSRYLERIEKTGFSDTELLSDVQFSSDAEATVDPWRNSLRSVTIRAFKPSAG